jgi:hypothetical protein
MEPSKPSSLSRLLLLVTGLGVAAGPLGAQSAGPEWSLTGYLQQSWPRQTETNRQIKVDINGGLGTHFKTWDDVANLNVGVIGLRQVAPGWRLGVQVDYSQGKLHGQEPVDLSALGLGPGSVRFEQRYGTYADLLAMVHYRPWGEAGRWAPFLLAGAGFAYEQDTTQLRFTSDSGGGEVELLRVENHGWFPMLTAGVGLDVFLSDRRDWFAQIGVSQSWARLRRDAAAAGLLAPGPTVKADTDSTGPNAWLGLGTRF